MKEPQRPRTKPAEPPAERAASRCPQCFSREHRPFEAPLEAGAWTVVECVDCNLLHSHPFVLPDDWDALYPPEYPPHQVKQTSFAWRSQIGRWWERRILAWYRNYPLPSGVRTKPSLLPRLLRPMLKPTLDPMVPPMFGAGRLLDIGCGTGEYLATMQRLGWETVGLERSPQAVATAKLRYHVPVIYDGVPTADIEPRSFDVVTCWQVLEHLERPRQSLRFFHQTLRPGGRLYLTVPNANGWAARWFGPAWIGWDLPRHLTHFDSDSLVRMLSAEGFRIQELRTLPKSGWVRHSARRALGAGITNRPLERRLQWLEKRPVSSVVAAWHARRGAGDSLYAVARPIG